MSRSLLLAMGIVVCGCGSSDHEIPGDDNPGDSATMAIDGSDESSVPDSAAPDTEADAPEVAADASPVDSDVADSFAPADVGDAADSPTAWCESGSHALCDDFDPSRDSTWASDLSPAAAAVVSTAHAVSPPNSLRCSIPAGANGSALTFNGLSAKATTAVHVEGSVWVESAPVTTMVLLVIIDGKHLWVSTGPDGLKFNHKQSVSVTTIALGDALTAGAWHHVSIDVATPTSSVTVKVDGTVALPATVLPMTFPVAPPVSMSAGAQVKGTTSTPTVVFVDNIALDR